MAEAEREGRPAEKRCRKPAHPVKREINEEMKSFAESTMNELLGWYGYEKVELKDGEDIDLQEELDQISPIAKEILIPQKRSAEGSSLEDGQIQPWPDMPGHTTKDQTTWGGFSTACLPSAESPRHPGPKDYSNVSLVIPLVPHPLVKTPPEEESQGGQAVCAWCQKSGSKRYTLSMGSEAKNFCSEKCFTSCRRAYFKRNKAAKSHVMCEMTQGPDEALPWEPLLRRPAPPSDAELKSQFCSVSMFFSAALRGGMLSTECRSRLVCIDWFGLFDQLILMLTFLQVCDWCKHIRHTKEYLDFGDGERRLQFCSVKCLNQYKMDIFYKEAQASLPTTPLASALVPPFPDQTAKTERNGLPVLTPDSWNLPPSASSSSSSFLSSTSSFSSSAQGLLEMGKKTSLSSPASLYGQSSTQQNSTLTSLPEGTRSTIGGISRRGTPLDTGVSPIRLNLSSVASQEQPTPHVEPVPVVEGGNGLQPPLLLNHRGSLPLPLFMENQLRPPAANNPTMSHPSSFVPGVSLPPSLPVPPRHAAQASSPLQRAPILSPHFQLPATAQLPPAAPQAPTLPPSSATHPGSATATPAFSVFPNSTFPPPLLPPPMLNLGLPSLSPLVPPAMMLVPYPVIVPLPVPVPIPIPIPHFLFSKATSTPPDTPVDEVGTHVEGLQSKRPVPTESGGLASDSQLTSDTGDAICNYEEMLQKVVTQNLPRDVDVRLEEGESSEERYFLIDHQACDNEPLSVGRFESGVELLSRPLSVSPSPCEIIDLTIKPQGYMEPQVYIKQPIISSPLHDQVIDLSLKPRNMYKTVTVEDEEAKYAEENNCVEKSEAEVVPLLKSSATEHQVNGLDYDFLDVNSECKTSAADDEFSNFGYSGDVDLILHYGSCQRKQLGLAMAEQSALLMAKDGHVAEGAKEEYSMDENVSFNGDSAACGLDSFLSIQARREWTEKSPGASRVADEDGTLAYNSEEEISRNCQNGNNDIAPTGECNPFTCERDVGLGSNAEPTYGSEFLPDGCSREASGENGMAFNKKVHSAERPSQTDCKLTKLVIKLSSRDIKQYQSQTAKACKALPREKSKGSQSHGKKDNGKRGSSRLKRGHAAVEEQSPKLKVLLPLRQLSPAGATDVDKGKGRPKDKQVRVWSCKIAEEQVNTINKESEALLDFDCGSQNDLPESLGGNERVSAKCKDFSLPDVKNCTNQTAVTKPCKPHATGCRTNKQQTAEAKAKHMQHTGGKICKMATEDTRWNKSDISPTKKKATEILPLEPGELVPCSFPRGKTRQQYVESSSKGSELHSAQVVEPLCDNHCPNNEGPSLVNVSTGAERSPRDPCVADHAYALRVGPKRCESEQLVDESLGFQTIHTASMIENVKDVGPDDFRPAVKKKCLRSQNQVK
uniref:uncharacterized protein n=1 Tax=Myxine glutinosa TaxID=7769 RepID=UPI00358EBF75